MCITSENDCGITPINFLIHFGQKI